MNGFGKYSEFANIKLCAGENSIVLSNKYGVVLLYSIQYLESRLILITVGTVIGGQMFLPKCFN